MYREKTVYITTHKSARGPRRRDVTHILSKVSCFSLKSFIFVGYRNDRFFPDINPYISAIFRMLRNNVELGLPVVTPFIGSGRGHTMYNSN